MASHKATDENSNDAQTIVKNQNNNNNCLKSNKFSGLYQMIYIYNIYLKSNIQCT